MNQSTRLNCCSSIIVASYNSYHRLDIQGAAAAMVSSDITSRITGDGCGILGEINHEKCLKASPFTISDFFIF